MKTELHTNWTVGDICKGFVYDKNDNKGLFGLDGQNSSSSLSTSATTSMETANVMSPWLSLC